MAYVIIAILLVVIYYLMGTSKTTSHQTVLMASKYQGLVFHMLNWDKSSRMTLNDKDMLVVEYRSMFTNGAKFSLLEKADGKLKITFNLVGDSNYDSINFEESYPQTLCIVNNDLVWEAIKERIENSLLDNTRRQAQDLVDRFYNG
jgi:hypothetical protein